MGKVINMWTGKEVTQMPVTVQDGEALIENLIRFDMSYQGETWLGTTEIVDQMITMVENNSGASRFDVLTRMHQNKRKA